MKKFEEVKALYNTIQHIIDTEKEESGFTISGLTADFDRLFELAWKTLKEYMYTELGIRAAKTGSPKDIIRLAYAEHLIDNEDMWIQLVNDRNDDAHIYLESSARAYASRIVRDYMPFMKTFITKMSTLIPADDSVLIKTPKSFVDAAKRSGMYYDEFLKKVMQKHHFSDEADLFRHWNQIEAEYSNKTAKEIHIF